MINFWNIGQYKFLISVSQLKIRQLIDIFKKINGNVLGVNP